ncbi:MAG: PD-(D/E)XK nuclease family protein [Cyanobacteria bacterium P01_A01_bin.135]
MALRLSQSHLAVLALCPRKFQYLYLDQIGEIGGEIQQPMVWGSQFHQLMLQQDIGLPVPLTDVATDPELSRCVAVLKAVAPQLFDPASVRQSEYPISAAVAGHTLVAVYDRLLLKGDRAIIYDWKTYAKPLSPSDLANQWQTRLYLYLLAQVGEYAPQALSMVYWFVRLTPSHPQPTSVELHYSAAQHQQTHAELTQRLQQLNHWLDHYSRQALPQLPADSPHCARCPFAVCCDRLPSQREAHQLLALDSIDELPP